MSVISSTNKVLPKNTISKLFSILESVKKSEKGDLIKDWIVRYGGNNPIFEEGDDDDHLTIFLLVRNNTTTHWKKLYLVGDSFGWDTPHLKFTPIEDTRWYYIKFKRPKGARLHYMLSPNDPGTRITNETRPTRWANFIVDERNPDCFDEGVKKHSVIQLPDFVNTIRETKKAPEFTKIYMRSKIDGNRSARFCVVGDSPKKLLIAHDGAAFSQIMKAQDVIAKGVDDGRWPSMVILSLNTPLTERVREYGGRYGYPKFFNEVIIPTIEQHIGRKFDKSDIILHGSSLGAWGLLDVSAHVHVADNLILHSCPFWWPDDEHQKYIRELTESDKFSVKRLYFDVGVYETGRVPLSTYESNQRFASMLKREIEDGNLDLEFMGREFLMGHRYNAWVWALPAALDFIFTGKKEYGPLPGRELTYKEEYKPVQTQEAD